MSFTIEAVIKAVDQASRNLEHITESVNRLSKSFSTLGEMAKIAGGFIVAQIGIRAFDAVKNFVEGSIDAFAAQEWAIMSLKTQMEILGEDWNVIGESMIAVAKNLAEKSVYSDEQIIAAMQRLATFGMSSKEILEAISVVVDLAAAKNLDLATAADAVGKAYAGHTETLSRYGIILEKGADQVENFKNLMTLLNLQFGGTAQAQLDTYSGKMKQFHNRINEAQEAIGSLFIPVIEMGTKILGEFASWLERIAPIVKDVLIPAWDMLKDALDMAFTSLKDLAKAFGLNIEDIDTMGRFIGLLIGGALMPFIAIIKGVAVAIEGLSMVIQGWRFILETIWNVVLKPIVDFLYGVFITAINAVRNAIEYLASVWNNMWMSMKAVTDATVGPIVNTLQWLINTAINAFNWLNRTLVRHSIWPDMWSKMLDITQDYSNAIKSAIENTLTLPTSMPITFTPTLAELPALTIPVTPTLTELPKVGYGAGGYGEYAYGPITIIVNATTTASAEEITNMVVSALRRRRR
ncbi:MAG: hypothetical protein QW618_00445 [Nitrososphaerales archaeon]